ncbi:MAG: helix-turn-helix domain-containing protein [Clostridia bacterium]|nr:helix-turn-helix domain-containing protein [Clostridia bacterium]
MNRIRELRKESNLTMRELGAKLDLAESTVSLYETGGREPDISTVLKIADFFRVSTDYLLGRDKITPEERALGLSETKKESITPLEDDMLYLFREIGKKYGIETQKSVITMMKNMLDIKI